VVSVAVDEGRTDVVTPHEFSVGKLSIGHIYPSVYSDFTAEIEVVECDISQPSLDSASSQAQRPLLCVDSSTTSSAQEVEAISKPIQV
jgi:hypothetical protein